MKRFAALLLSVMCLCSFACAEEGSQLKDWLGGDVTQSLSELFANETLITAKGTVKTEAVKDTAVLSFAIRADAETVAEANQKATVSITALKEALIAQGVEEQNIWNKWYDVTADVQYHNSRLTSKEVIEGYVVEITLCVKLTDISLVGAVIDAATQSGAGSTHELSFESSTAAEAYESALGEAVQQARNRAEKLAQAAGLTLGETVSVTELSAQADGEASVEIVCRAK